MIIDVHLHLPAIKNKETLEESKKKLIFEMNKNKIDYGIIIPDNVHGSKIGDLDDLLPLVAGERGLFLIGTIDIRTEGKEWIQKLNRLFKKREIIGIKIFPGHDPIYPTDKRLTPLYKLCIEYDFPMIIHTGWNTNDPKVAKYNDPKYIIKIARKFPRLKIIIAHYFWPEVDYCYEITRGFKNIYFDTSALADDEVIEKTGLGKIKSVLERTMRDNPDSILFGTDYAMCNQRKHIKLINSLNISNDDKKKIFYENAIKLFNLKLK